MDATLEAKLLSCISSRITMDIHIVEITVLLISVIMSYSQFRRIKTYT